MPLTKHDSTVVLEVIAAFSIIPLLAIAFFLSQIALEIKKEHAMNNTAATSITSIASDKKIGVSDLDPEFLNALGQNFQQTQIALGQSNQEIGFFMNKILQKNFSEEEIAGLRSEYEAAIKAQQEAAKAQESTQAQQTAPTENTAPSEAPAAQ